MIKNMCQVSIWVAGFKKKRTDFITEPVSTSVRTAGSNEDSGIFEPPASCIVS